MYIDKMDMVRTVAPLYYRVNGMDRRVGQNSSLLVYHITGVNMTNMGETVNP